MTSGSSPPDTASISKCGHGYWCIVKQQVGNVGFKLTDFCLCNFFLLGSFHFIFV